ncbi:MAG TPA: membrane protein insertion efficiency factor YidD [Clostridia bacterium]|nr:membrane protein insertion efficiency factor YidD [Clostridia bacterium]
MKRIVLKCIRFYQNRISPHLPPMCRYYPTCSNYAIEAINVHGLLKGGLLALRRVFTCNVLFPGGYDPVPPAKPDRDDKSAPDSKHKNK